MSAPCYRRGEDLAGYATRFGQVSLDGCIVEQVTLINSLHQPPVEAHAAIVQRGYEWLPCECDHGRIFHFDDAYRCLDCWGDGGRYVSEENDPETGSKSRTIGLRISLDPSLRADAIQLE